MISNSSEPQLTVFPIGEYDALELEMASVRNRLKSLESRFAALTDQLDRLTSPRGEFRLSQSPLPRRGFEFLGQFVAGSSCIAIHHAILRLLWIKFPELRDTMATAAAQHSRSRLYIARTPERLFLNRDSTWVRKHSRVLVDTWVIDCNLSSAQLKTILRSVVTAAGLKWGEHVRVQW